MNKILAMLTCLFAFSANAAFPDASSLELCGEREGGYYVAGKYKNQERLAMKLLVDLGNQAIADGLAASGLSGVTRDIILGNLPTTVKAGTFLDFSSNGAETYLKINDNAPIGIQAADGYAKIFAGITTKLKAGGWKTDLSACN